MSIASLAASLLLTSPAFDVGAPIPRAYTGHVLAVARLVGTFRR